MRALNGEPKVISFSAVLQRRGRGQARPLTRSFPVTRPVIPSAAAYDRGFREGLRVRRELIVAIAAFSALAGILVGRVL